MVATMVSQTRSVSGSASCVMAFEMNEMAVSMQASEHTNKDDFEIANELMDTYEMGRLRDKILR